MAPSMQAKQAELELSDWLSEAAQGQILRALPLGAAPRLLVADALCSKSVLRQFWQPFSRLGKLRRHISLVALPAARRYQVNAAIWRELGEVASARLGEQVELAALLTGTPGAYQKVTGLLIDKGAAAFACVKMARHPLAQQQVQNEQAQLQRLNTLPALHGTLPKMLAAFSWRDRQCLVLSFGAGRVSDGRMTAPVLDFLSRLRVATAREQRLRESHWWQTLNDDIGQLNDRLPARWQTRFIRATATLADQLIDRPIIFSTVHGDFAPWNIRIQGQNAFVFDWESARAAAPCWFDYFHFGAMQAANAKRRYELTASTSAWLGTLAPTIEANNVYVLYLAYLLDISVYYARARVLVPEQGSGDTWDWFGAEIDSLLVRP